MKKYRDESVLPLCSDLPFISAYRPKLRVSISFDGPGQTKQSFKDECDINTIMSRYMRTGVLPEVLQTLEAQYLDVSEMEFQASMELVAGAYSMFNELPSSVRSRFKNDPGAFLDFASRESNRLEMAEMGLLTPEATEAIREATRTQNNRSTGVSANISETPSTPAVEKPPQTS